VANATAQINSLSVNVSTCCTGPPVEGGEGQAIATFTDILTVAGLQQSFDAAFQLFLDPEGGGDAYQLYPTLQGYLFGPGTGCDASGNDYLNCSFGQNFPGIIG
jgi:hypothetical protein